MLFNSISFIVFLAIVLGLYYLAPLSWTFKKVMLLFFSYLFYALWNPPLIILLWISTLIDWVAGKKLFKETRPRKRTLWLLMSLFANLGFLAFFKYGGFLLDNFTFMVNSVGMDFHPAKPDIILPMGISFYTFQTMSYSIDMYLKRAEPAKDFLDFSLYVTFFPQLVAGPIVRSSELVSQFYKPKRATTRQFLWGLFFLTLGLFEKVVMADTLLSSTSDKVFNSGKILNVLDAWSGTLAFSGQIFFDFAGYSTCAIGIAMLLGITLPDNFRYPYAALGFSDLWRRWHISLSSWLRDYLYIPLGGNRRGQTRTNVNLMLTMLLGGLWHGAAWTFVFWGMLHGFYLMTERYLRKYIKIKINAWNGILLALATYLAVNITWVFFRSGDFGTARNMLASMFFMHPNGEMVLHYIDILKVFVVISVLFLIQWFMRNTSVKAMAEKIPWWALGFCWAAKLILLAVAQGTGEKFIYFQF